MSAPKQRLTTRQLAAALTQVRDNDIAALVDGRYVPVTGIHYDALPDFYCLSLDPTGVEDAILGSAQMRALDAAMYTVVLHGNWYWLTRNMALEEREAAAEAVRRHEPAVSDDTPATLDDAYLRWWAEEYRFTARGVDTERITGGAWIEYEGPDGQTTAARVARRGARSAELDSHGGNATIITFDQVTKVVSSPVDGVLARLDARPDTPEEA